MPHANDKTSESYVTNTQVEGWMRSQGHHRCVALAGMDCLTFWEKKDYTSDFSLNPESWGLLQDPFGNSKVIAKDLESVDDAH